MREAIANWAHTTTLSPVHNVNLLLEQLPEIARSAVLVQRLVLRAASMYQDPLLRYHNWAHVESMLNAYTHFWGEPHNEVRLAIVYHDCVYVPGSPAGMNEELSASAFEYAFRMMVPEDQRAGIDWEFVSEIIRATKVEHHLSPTYKPTSHYINRVLDCDLASLATDYHSFCLQQQRVRMEYTAEPDTIASLRQHAEFLVRFLDKEYIYHTTEARSEWEEGARSNIQRFYESS